MKRNKLKVLLISAFCIVSSICMEAKGADAGEGKENASVGLVTPVMTEGLPAGSITAFCGEEIPYGWLLCDGHEYSSQEYPELYKAVKTKYVPLNEEPRVLQFNENEDNFYKLFYVPNLKGICIEMIDQMDHPHKIIHKPSQGLNYIVSTGKIDKKISAVEEFIKSWVNLSVQSCSIEPVLVNNLNILREDIQKLSGSLQQRYKSVADLGRLVMDLRNSGNHIKQIIHKAGYSTLRDTERNFQSMIDGKCKQKAHRFKLLIDSVLNGNLRLN